MKKIEFENKSARRIYDDYLKKIERNSRVLSKEDTSDLLMDFNSHIYEGIHNSDLEDEVEKLLDVLEKLGDPGEVLSPLVADKKLYQATKSFNPKQVFQAISLKIRFSFGLTIIGLLYLFLFVFLLLVPVKVFAPENTGLFYFEGNFGGFGYISYPEGYEEVMGYWFIPAVLATATLIYIGITLLLRLWRK